MKVYFIGAGPGATDLITLRGKALVERCPVIIYAGSLVNPDILNFADQAAEIHDSNPMSLEEQVAVMKRAADANQDVARLHTGDPAIYGAIAEQMVELRKLGIEYEVVPGVSSAFAAAAAVGQELTLPGVTQSVVLTRRAGKTPVPEGEEIPAFAKATPSMMLFLSAGDAEGLAAELMPHYGEDCSVAVVYRASWPDQKIIRCTLGNLASEMAAAGIKQQAMIIVSKVFDAEVERSFLYSHQRTEGMK
ncbi:MAG: precorrin-4 C(11)-methyltransferase [Planctomycetota bacterium]